MNGPEFIQQETDQVVGSEKWPFLGDRALVPYMDTVLHEILRFADIIPRAMHCAVTQDTQLWGYHIPKVQAKCGSPGFSWFSGLLGRATGRTLSVLAS